jgi:hypothetical protein
MSAERDRPSLVSCLPTISVTLAELSAGLLTDLPGWPMRAGGSRVSHSPRRLTVTCSLCQRHSSELFGVGRRQCCLRRASVDIQPDRSPEQEVRRGSPGRVVAVRMAVGVSVMTAPLPPVPASSGQGWPGADWGANWRLRQLSVACTSSPGTALALVRAHAARSQLGAVIHGKEKVYGSIP